MLEIENVSPVVEQEADIIDEAEIDAGKAYAQKRPKMNFIEMGIPIGSELVFNNNGEIAIVVSEKSVRYAAD